MDIKKNIQVGLLPVTAGLIVFGVLTLAEQFLGAVIGQAATVAALGALLAGYVVNAHQNAANQQAEAEHRKVVEKLLEEIRDQTGPKGPTQYGDQGRSVWRRNP